MSDVTIYHNPKCGTSRNTLAMIRNAGIEPQVVLYLETPPSRAQLKALFKRAGVGVRDALREKGTPYAELGLDNPALDDEALLDAIEAHPILLNCPSSARRWARGCAARRSWCWTSCRRRSKAPSLRKTARP